MTAHLPVRDTRPNDESSGSKTQTDGTFTVASPFWRRASRKSAEGSKTDLAVGFLLSSNGGKTNLTHQTPERQHHSDKVVSRPSC